MTTRCSHGVPLEHVCHECMTEGLERVAEDAAKQDAEPDKPQLPTAA